MQAKRDRVRIHSSCPPSDFGSDFSADKPVSPRHGRRPTSVSSVFGDAMSSRFLPAAAALAAAMLPALRSAAPLSLDQALDLAAQRSQGVRAAHAGASSAAEVARRRATSRPDAECRHRQPAGDRAGTAADHRRLHDHEAGRHQPGVGLGREAGVAPGGGAGPGGARVDQRASCAGASAAADGAGVPGCLLRRREPEAHDADRAPRARGVGGGEGPPGVFDRQQPGSAADDGGPRSRAGRVRRRAAAPGRRAGRAAEVGRPHPDSLSAPALPALPAEQSTTSMPPRAGSPSLTRTSRT